MKYLLYSNFEVPKDPTITGLFQWASVFNGDIGRPKDELLSEYDVVHVNCTARGFSTVGHIRSVIGSNSKTKIIANVDYAYEMWSHSIEDPRLFFREIDKADHVFHVEERGAEALSLILGREVPTLPHPVNSEIVEGFRTSARVQRIATLAHRWDLGYFDGWLITQSFTGVEKMLVTGIPQEEASAGTPVGNAIPLFDSHLPKVSHSEFLTELAKSFCALETYKISSYGRYTIECAALGVPCVTPTCVQSSQVCFPLTTYKTGDIKEARSLILKLLEDPDFYIEVAKLAAQLSEHYGHDMSRERFERMVSC